jgi:hypothetical protein
VDPTCASVSNPLEKDMVRQTAQAVLGGDLQSGKLRVTALLTGRQRECLFRPYERDD